MKTSERKEEANNETKRRTNGPGVPTERDGEIGNSN